MKIDEKCFLNPWELYFFFLSYLGFLDYQLAATPHHFSTRQWPGTDGSQTFGNLSFVCEKNKGQWQEKLARSLLPDVCCELVSCG